MINNFLLDNVFKNSENPKEWCVSFKGMDYEKWQPLPVNEFIQGAERNDSWNAIKPEIYEKALGTVGLDFASYENPEEMWSDFLSAVEENKRKLTAKESHLTSR